MMIEYKDIQEAEEVLGKPVFIGFNEETYRARRNLIIIAFIALIYSLSGAKIGNFHPLGIQFKDFNPSYIDIFFLGATFYSFIHFLWLSVDAVQEWRIRLTGTKLAFQTGAKLTSGDGDYPDDPRQSSLLTWWNTQAERIGNFKPLAQELEGQLKDENFLAENSKKFDTLQRDLTNVTKKITEFESVLKSKRIPVSLERFERWYKMFSYSQLLRFALLEWGFPAAIGVWALYGLLTKIFFCN